MCCRALVPKKACGSEKESASAYRYLKPRGTGSSQPIDKIPVMLETPGTDPPGHKKHVVGTEGLSYGVRFNPKPSIVDDVPAAIDLAAAIDTPASEAGAGID